MWNPFRSRKADVISHWYVLVPGFRTSTQDFYSSVEQQLQELKVPELELSRAEFSEGGPLSANREYLRMSRERLVFDVCAAPFGTSFFFSMRFAELPSVVNFLAIVVMVFLFLFFWFVIWKIFGFFLGTFLLILTVVGTMYVLRNAVRLGLQNLDATLIKAPLVGPVYEAFFRKETYYREDTRLMYFETVNSIVKAMVEEVTSAKGIKLLPIKQRSPLLDDLYKLTPIQMTPAPEVTHEPPG